VERFIDQYEYPAVLKIIDKRFKLSIKASTVRKYIHIGLVSPSTIKHLGRALGCQSLYSTDSVCQIYASYMVLNNSLHMTIEMAQLARKIFLGFADAKNWVEATAGKIYGDHYNEAAEVLRGKIIEREYYV